MALEIASDAVIAMWLGLVAFLLPAAASMTAGLGTVAEVAFALAAMLSTSVVWTILHPVVVRCRLAGRAAIVDCCGLIGRMPVRFIVAGGLIDRVQM